MEDQATMPIECSHPPALSDLDLIAALDGEAPGDVAAHLRICGACAGRAHRFAELQNLLRKQLYRITCPSSDQLLAFRQQWLDSSQMREIQLHVSSCPHCAADLRLLTDADSAPDPPGPSARRRIVAELAAPRAASPFAPIYGALRGAAGGQYAYRAEHMQLMIDVERAAAYPGRLTLLGLLLPDDSYAERLNNATASLLHDDAIITTAPLDDLGNFVLEDVAPGDYSLSLRLPDREVVVEALSL